MVALIETAPPAERMAVTMTGELCDCFPTKADGVRHIVDAAAAAGGSRDVACISSMVGWCRSRKRGIRRTWPRPATGTRWRGLPADSLVAKSGC